MPINQGWYNNLWVEVRQLSSRYLELRVRLVCRFIFQQPDHLPAHLHPWTPQEQTRWKGDFTTLVQDRWRRKHRLYADVSTDLIDPRRVLADLPLAEVEFRIIDVDSPRATVPEGQVHHEIHVWRGARGRAHASAADRVAALQEDALQRLPIDGGEQTAGLHEVGHLIGLVHSGCPSHVQTSDQDLAVMNSPECYRDGTEGGSVMGLGDTIQPRDYLVFAYIMRRLRPQWLWFVGHVRAEYRGGRRVSLDRGLISPSQDTVGPVPGVLARGAIYPSLSMRESRGVA